MIGINDLSSDKFSYILENGVELTYNDWNSDHFIKDNQKYYPIFKTNNQNCFELDVIGFEYSKFQADKCSDYIGFKG